MPLNADEKERVRYHLGYLNISQQTALGLGFPSASQLQFIVESSMNEVLPESEKTVRRAIQELDCIEDQLSTFRTSLEVTKSGNVGIRGPEAFAELERQYGWWSGRLADNLGVPLNPFSITQSYQGVNGQGAGLVIEPQG